VVRAASLGLGDEDEPVLRYVSSRERRAAADVKPLELAPVPSRRRSESTTTRRSLDRLLGGNASGTLKPLDREGDTRANALDFIPSGSPLGGCGSYVSGFGYRRDPFTGRRAFHAGLDISSPAGTPIYATADGVVLYSGRDGFLGKCVKIDHGNGIITVYAHNSDNYVEVGDHVQRGDMIAEVGSTGRATGPHVHYGVLVNDEHVNPLSFLQSDEVAD
jgi:murein DD-endopeptidase MepM/ murein hydrolase activator NlpD